ncbi:hypothetical protein [Flavobacterium sp. ZB4P13]|uniref:hypothetical protein n=1 Tax=Flavobacterium sp. ZB4P13 TaxID=3401728 RepID=UPI003AAD6531
MKKSIPSILIAIIATLGIPLFIYIYYFKNQNISDKSSNWGEFGSYISAAISLCNLVIFIILTRELQRYNEKEGQHTKDLQKPILSFFKPNNSSNFAIKNVGAGTALNIFVRYGYDSNKNTFNFSDKCYSLGRDSAGELNWNDQINIIVAQYDDIFGNRYYSYFEDNDLRFFSDADGKKRFPHEYKIATLPIIKYSIEK